MSSFKEKVKDFLYNAMDFVIIAGIILVVIGIISWRLDILFTGPDSEKTSMAKKDRDKSSVMALESKDQALDLEDEDSKTDNDLEKTETKTQDKEESQGKSQDKEIHSKSAFVKISIPSGSVSTKIGEILVDANLIKNVKVFNDKCEEMNMTTKLKSGDFEIPKNASVEDIINIITK